LQLDSFVEYPVKGLDLTPFVQAPNPQPHLYDLYAVTVRFLSPAAPLSQQLGFNSLARFSPFFAHIVGFALSHRPVQEHHGVLGGGHYTAVCLNRNDGRWYRYDDTKVSAVTEESDLVSDAAYLLFYKRRPVAAAADAQ